MSRKFRDILIASAAAALTPLPAFAGFVDPIAATIPDSPIKIGVETLTTGLTSPVYMVSAPDATGRLFIVDQVGQVRIFQGGALVGTPFLDVSSLMVPLDPAYDERGLLGLAFHPDFATNGKVYSYHSAPLSGSADFTVPLPPGFAMNHQSVINEWTVDPANPNLIDPSSRREVMRIDEPQANHNGGTLAFGPDGFLYISLGDGGGSDDQDGEIQGDGSIVQGHGPTGNGQNIENVLGKVLRIDVDGNNSTNGEYGVPATNPFVGGAGVDEIFAYGFRNPYRMAFDPVTGQLIAGDVGQHNIEEVDIVTIGGNYGWRVKEGSFLFDPDGPVPGDDSIVTVDSPGVPPGLIDPVVQYDHSDGITVIGGFVYRGAELPVDFLGQYIFGDFSIDSGIPAGRLFVADLSTGEIFDLLGTPLTFFLKGFGVDDAGEIYALVSSDLGPTGFGAVLRLVAAEVPEPGMLGLLGLGLGLAALAAKRRRD